MSMGFSRQEYCSGLLFPPPGDLPGPGTELVSLASPELAGGFFTTVHLEVPMCDIYSMVNPFLEVYKQAKQ